MTAYTVQEWTTVDKSTWGDGPWQAEPDKVHWIDEATDLDCLMVRNPHIGNWCGYVAVTEGHPLFEVGYGGCTERRVDADGEPERWCDHMPSINVHGGLTYSDFCMETDDPSRLVCHVPYPGRPDRVWWFGFDCAHLHDRSPGYEALGRDRGWPSLREPLAEYRDRAYVEGEVRRLALQLAAVA